MKKIKGNYDTDEVTISDLIKKIKETRKILYVNKWYIILSTIIFTAIFFSYSFFSKTRYKAELTFMVYQDESTKIGGGLSSMLGAIGLPSADKVNLEKIIELSKSNQILFQTFFDTITIGNKKDFIINQFIQLYNLDKEFNNKIRFSSSIFEDFTLEKKEILNITKNFLVGKNGILESNYGVKTGIMSFSIITLNEKLSLYFIKNIFKNLSEYYIDKSIAKEKKTYEIIKNRVERIYATMNYKERSAASYEDQTLGVWQELDKIPSKIDKRDATINALIYGEALKNLEIADFTLRNRTPFIQEIDVPFTPLQKITKSVKIYTTLGIILGCFIGILLVLMNAYFKSIEIK